MIGFYPIWQIPGYLVGYTASIIQPMPKQTMQTKNHHVVVLGATPKPGRYANQAIRLLQEHDYRITPVHPKISAIEGLPVVSNLAEITDPVDTLTLYVGPARLEPMLDELMALNPRRVIFNPGTESTNYQQRLDEANIEWFEACTLVMLKTNQFLS